MGINADYFRVASDELAAALLDGGPAEVIPADAMVEAKGLDPTVEMGSLEEILTGQDYDTVVGNPRQGLTLASDDEGVFVVAITAELRDALAAADEARLRTAAAELAATEELHLSDQEDIAALADVLVALAGLARGARERGEGMYCWMCL